MAAVQPRLPLSCHLDAWPVILLTKKDPTSRSWITLRVIYRKLFFFCLKDVTRFYFMPGHEAQLRNPDLLVVLDVESHATIWSFEAAIGGGGDGFCDRSSVEKLWYL